MIIAIDGPSASGKTTLGRMLARHLHLPFVDSGQLYRAVTLLAIDQDVSLTDEQALAAVAAGAAIELNTAAGDNPRWQVRAQGRDLTDRIFDKKLSAPVSRVSRVAGVRQALLDQQRAYGPGGVVMVGRDIGTVVFPHADLKIFLIASAAERRRRRGLQMGSSDAELLEGEIDERDLSDESRAVAPLRAAEDAYTIDTDARSPDQVLAEVLRLISLG